jgi:hypothetical protein
MGELMAFAQNFDKKLQETLNQLAHQYSWVTGWSADRRSKVDVVGLANGVPRILIEIELKKDNPVENVVKIWRWATANRIKTRILFLHAFSAHYLSDAGSTSRTAKAKQYERAVFIGKRMEKDQTLNVRYCDLPIRTTTRKGRLRQFKPLMRRGVTVKAGGGAMLRAAENLAERITKMLRSSRP